MKSMISTKRSGAKIGYASITTNMTKNEALRTLRDLEKGKLAGTPIYAHLKKCIWELDKFSGKMKSRLVE